jgi:hypothetical protein
VSGKAEASQVMLMLARIEFSVADPAAERTMGGAVDTEREKINVCK